MAKKLVKILSIDGGGVRSLVPAYILAEIEKRTHKKIAESFDIIAGNSMGSLIAAQLVTPDENGKIKYSAEDILNNSNKYYPRIFKKSWLMTHFHFLNFFQPSINTHETEKMLNEIFGKTMLSQATAELLIPSFEIESDKPFIFKRWQAKKDISFDFELKDAVLASSSMPTVLAPHVVDQPNDSHVKHYAFVDGGVVANSPALCTYVEAKTLFPDATDFLVVSLGTGTFTGKMLIEKIHHWGIINWAPQILDLLISSQAYIANHELKTLLAAPSDQLRHYFQIQFHLKEGELSIDDVSPIHLHELGLRATDVVKENEDQIQQICSLLD